MSRTKSTGGKGNGEYWSRRPGPIQPGRSSKTITHRLERLQSKRLVSRIEDEIIKDRYEEIRLNKVLDEQLIEPWDDFYRPFDDPIDDFHEPFNDPFTYPDPDDYEDLDDSWWWYDHEMYSSYGT